MSPMTIGIVGFIAYQEQNTTGELIQRNVSNSWSSEHKSGQRPEVREHASKAGPHPSLPVLAQGRAGAHLFGRALAHLQIVDREGAKGL